MTGVLSEGVTRCQRCDALTRYNGLCGSCAADELADDTEFEEDEFDPEGPAFECAGYYPEPAGEFYCPLWGTEECDWECPR